MTNCICCNSGDTFEDDGRIVCNDCGTDFSKEQNV